MIERSRASSSVRDAPILDSAKHRLNFNEVSSAVVYRVRKINPAPVVAAHMMLDSHGGILITLS